MVFSSWFDFYKLLHLYFSQFHAEFPSILIFVQTWLDCDLLNDDRVICPFSWLILIEIDVCVFCFWPEYGFILLNIFMCKIIVEILFWKHRFCSNLLLLLFFLIKNHNLFFFILSVNQTEMMKIHENCTLSKRRKCERKTNAIQNGLGLYKWQMSIFLK